MAFDFDHLPDLTAGDSVKWNRYAGRDILPLWIADMDFPAPPALVEALTRRVGQARFTYAEPWPSLVEAVQTHLKSAYDWSINPDWLVWLPGLVTGLNLACRAVPGSIFSATPVYPPFLTAPLHAGRALLTASLQAQANDAGLTRWEWDFAAVVRALRPDTGLFLLCHPHNPVGRSWREEELREIDLLAARHTLIVCSDEIHCDLVLDPGQRHRPYATLSEEAAQRSITLMAPSKTFNIAGLGCAFAIIPNPRLRRSFCHAMQGLVPHVNTLGLAACEAAYREGQDWHLACLERLRQNRDWLMNRLQNDTNGTLRPNHVEAGYLMWIDAGELARRRGLDHPQVFFEQAGLGLSAGQDFDLPRQGENPSRRFVRFNFACPPDLLQEAFRRIKKAL